jgi:hypothetical protein
VLNLKPNQKEMSRVCSWRHQELCSRRWASR